MQLVTGFVVLGIVVGVAGTVLAAGVGGHAFALGTSSAIGRALLLGGLATILAALLGFMLAVPRGALTPDGSRGRQRAGTQLEQVSDWMLKVLLGAALVSFNRWPDIGERLADMLALGEPRYLGAGLGELIACYFAAFGVVAGYASARIHFMSVRDRAPFVITALEALQRVGISPHGRPRSSLTLEELEAVEAFGRIPVSKLHRSYDERQWAKAQLVAPGGDLREAAAVYRRLLKLEKDPQLSFELAAVERRLEAGPADAIGRVELQEQGTDHSTPAAINRMFNALYEPAPGGFEDAIAIGEDLVLRVSDASTWAYLACAYGQRYRYELGQDGAGGSASSPETARERALFCIKQAVELDAARWRPALRSFWDPSAVRFDGDDDLTVFYGDPQFAALLDPEGSTALSVAANSSGGSRLVRYDGSAQMWLADESGAVLEGAKPTLHPSHAYRLFVRLVPTEAPRAYAPGGVTHEVKVLEGEVRPRVEFDFRPDAVEMRFSPERGGVTASLSSPTTECSFDFRAPAPRGTGPEDRDIYLEVAQGRRILRTLPVTVTLAAADA